MNRLTKWLKFLIALLLLPLVAAVAWTLADIILGWLPEKQWQGLPFVMLAAGFAGWWLVFFLLPRPMWFYVLGHEMTHALAVYLAGGKVSDFKVTSRGGHIATDKVTWWIALAPYFIPFYTLIWLGLWFTIDFYHPLDRWQHLLYIVAGMTYGFHVSFTLSMLHPQQTDLSSEGYLFSGVVIVGLNLLIIGLAFIPVTNSVTWKDAALRLQARTQQCYGAIWELGRNYQARRAPSPPPAR